MKRARAAKGQEAKDAQERAKDAMALAREAQRAKDLTAEGIRVAEACQRADTLKHAVPPLEKELAAIAAEARSVEQTAQAAAAVVVEVAAEERQARRVKDEQFLSDEHIARLAAATAAAEADADAAAQQAPKGWELIANRGLEP